jgi:hypothetical protein
MLRLEGLGKVEGNIGRWKGAKASRWFDKDEDDQDGVARDLDWNTREQA